MSSLGRLGSFLEEGVPEGVGVEAAPLGRLGCLPRGRGGVWRPSQVEEAEGLLRWGHILMRLRTGTGGGVVVSSQVVVQMPGFLS